MPPTDFFKKINFKSINKAYYISLLLIVLLGILFFLVSAPSEFGHSTIIKIEKGETIKGTALLLKENNLIRSPALFNILILFYNNNVVEGDYFFDQPVNLFRVLQKITSGDYEMEIKNITFFEGMTVDQMATEFGRVFANFDSGLFYELAKDQEGYLFPDTYKFMTNVTPEIAFLTMRNNFNQKVAAIDDLINQSGKSLNDIIIMASIIEREATADTRQEVSNILWKRIEMGIPLQVDAPFVYSIQKGTSDLTLDDLAADNPYNTYKYLGLTPTPISNPGIESILAAATPVATENLFFLTGADGEMYFARNFEEHKKNRLLYLD